MTGQKRDFMAMFGGQNTNIDYSMPTDRAVELLPMPQASDDLQAVAAKIEKLSAIVEQGRSLAVATGYAGAKHQQRDPREIARAAMTPAEREQYSAWEKGVKMPAFDWAANRKPVEGGPEAQKRFRDRAAALNVIWGVEGATPENAAWLVANLPYAIPLVTAVVRVRRAEKDLVGGTKELDAVEMAEIQTARKIVAVAMENLNQAFAEVKNLSQRIHHAKNIIQTREHVIKSKLPNYKDKEKHRKDPVINDRHDQRTSFLGRPGIGAEFGDATALTSGKRVRRSNLVTGTGLEGDGASGSFSTSNRQRRAGESGGDVIIVDNGAPPDNPQ